MSSPEEPRTRNWKKRVGLAIAVVLLLAVSSRFVFRMWLHSRVPSDAPRIAFSLDSTWLNRLGVTSSTYEQAMSRAGGQLIDFQPEEERSGETLAARVDALLREHRIDGVLLTGGGDVDPILYRGDPSQALEVNRARDDFEIELIRQAKERGLPLLGICRGCQILNVAFGGTLQNLRDQEPLKEQHFTFSGHAVQLTKHSRLAQVLGTTQLENVQSFHGQAVERLGRGVRMAASARDGVCEAIEVESASDETWMLAVQWHPEMVPADKLQNRLFQAFIEEARKARTKRVSK